MESLPIVVKAEYVESFRIKATFADGTNGTVDFRDWLDGPIFELLREPSHFMRFYVEVGYCRVAQRSRPSPRDKAGAGA